jgi:pimeloyl-ACP methyl ester carboxylesterase
LRTASRPHLFLTDRGGGEAVLLITGWTISSAVFDPVAYLYLPHVRVIAYDHRGTGRSAAWPAPVSPALLAADAARVLDDRGLESAHVVGLSMGAAVALELAIRMPSRVKSLVLVGGGAGGPATCIPPARGAAAEIGSVVADTARHRRLWPAAALFSTRFRAEHPDLVAAYLPAFGEHRAPPWAILWQTLAVACFARGASLGRVRAPTLVLHGSEDVMSPADNARRLAEGIPGAELRLVAGSGHAVPLEQPEASARLLVGWVTRHADAAPPQVSGGDLIHERITRGWSLPAGALRNTRDAVVLVRQARRRRR